MPVVFVPGRGNVQFPDDMKPGQIEAAIRKLGVASPPAPKKDESFLSGVIPVAKKTAGEMIEGLGMLAGKIPSPSDLLFPRREVPAMGSVVSQYGKGVAQRAQAEMPEASVAEARRQQEFIKSATPGAGSKALSGLGQFAETVSEYLPSTSLVSLASRLLPKTEREAAKEIASVQAPFQTPRGAAEFVTQQAVTNLPLLVGGKGIELGIRGGAKLLGKEISRDVLAKGVEAGVVTAGGAINASSAGKQAYDDVIAAGGSKEEADRAFSIAAGGAAIASGFAAKLPGLEQQAFSTHGVQPGIIRGAVKAAAGEAPQEFIEEAGAQLATNVGKIGTAAEVDLGQGVLSSGALGAIGGAGFAAPVGAIQGLAARGGAPSEAPPATEPGAEPSADPIRTTTVVYPNREDPTSPVTRTLDVMSEPDEAGFVTVRDDAGKSFEMKADDLSEMEAATPAYTPSTEAPSAPAPAPAVDAATISERLRVASGVTEGVKEHSRVRALSRDITTALEANDPVAAQAAVQARLDALAASRMSEATKAQRQAELDEAQSIINDYRVEYARAQQAPQGARVEAPTVEPSSVEQALEQNAELAARDEAAAAEQGAAERSVLQAESELETATNIGRGSIERQAQTQRKQLFQSILENPDVQNPASEFRQALRDHGFQNTELNEDERRQIRARQAFERPANIVPYTGESEVQAEVLPPAQAEPVAPVEAQYEEVPQPLPPAPVAITETALAVTPSRRAQLMSGAADISTLGTPQDTSGQPAVVQQQAKATRREFLNGLAATAVATQAPEARAAPVEKPVTSSVELTDILNNGDHNAALKMIAERSTNPLYRKVASALMRVKGGIGNVQLYTVPEGGLGDAYGTTEYVNESGTSEVRLERSATGLSEEIFLHEMIHAYIQQRWLQIGKYLESNKRLVGDQVNRADQAIQNFQKLWDAAKSAMMKADPELVKRIEGFLEGEGDGFKGADVWALEFYRSPDEAISWLMTNGDARTFLQGIDMQGNSIKPGDKSLWSRFVDWIADLLGIKIDSSERSAFDELINSGMSILQAGEHVAPDRSFADKLFEFIDNQRVSQQMYAGRSVTEPRAGESEAEARERRIVADNYDVAQQMEDAGELPETIRLATGWDRNPYDGQWRYIVSDIGASQTEELSNLITDHGAYSDLHEGAQNADGTYPLSYLINHPDLYSAYPEAADISVSVKPSKKGSSLQGQYDPESKSLTVYTGAIDPVGTLLHEIQHWVQDREGFAFGSSSSSVWYGLSPEQKAHEARLAIGALQAEVDTLSEVEEIVSWLQANLRKGLGVNPTADQVEAALTPYLEENPWANEVVVDMAVQAILGYNATREAFGASPLPINRNSLSDIASDIASEVNDGRSMIEIIQDGDVNDDTSTASQLVQKYFKDGSDNRAMKRYLDTAGEIEARDVAQSRGKTLEELRASGMLQTERPRKPEDVVITYPGEEIAAPESRATPSPAQAATNKGADDTFRARMGARLKSLYRSMVYKYKAAPDLDKQLAAALGVDTLPAEMSLEDRMSMFETMKNGLLRDFERSWFHPFMSALEKSGVDPQDLGMYLWARSAADRNALVAERNRDMPDGGSGLTNIEAEAILAYYKASGLMRQIDPLVKMHDNLVDWMLKQRVKTGLMSQDEANLLRQNQPFYTPLKGFAAEGDMQLAGDDNPHEDYKGRAQAGVHPRDYIKTTGRASMPFNPMYNLIADGMRLTQRIARNEVGKRFLDIITTFPDLFGDDVKVYTDDHPKIVRKGVAPPGSKKKTVGPMNMAANAGKFLVVKKGGKNFYIEFNEKSHDAAEMRRMFDNMTPQQLDGIAKWMAKAGAFKKQLVTRFSPIFWIKNLIRDIHDAIVTAYSEQTRTGSPVEGKRVARRTTMYLAKPSTWKSVGQYLSGREPKTAGEIHNNLLLAEMIRDGGEAGHNYMLDAEAISKKIAHEVETIKSGDASTLWGKADKKRKALVALIDHINEFTALFPRFAAYRAALDEGVTPDQAAKFALDSTLNLARRGEATQLVDNIWLFTNPAIQSLEKKKRIYSSRNGRKAMAAMMGLGVMLHFWNMAMAGDDDDDGENDYQDMDEATKMSNLVIYTPDGMALKLPLGFMVAFEAYLGQQVARMVTGDGSGITIPRAAANALSAFVATQLPAGDKIGKFSDLSKLPVPDIFMPFVDLWRNENYFGGAIYPEPFYEGQAVSGMARRSTGEFYKQWAKTLNQIGGGTEDVASAMDTPAEAWKYLVDQNLLAGGPSVIKGVADYVMAGAPADAEKIPVVKSFVGDGRDYAAQNKYFDRAKKVEVIAGQADGVNADASAYEESQQKYPVDAAPEVIAAFKEADNALRALSKEKREAIREGGSGLNETLDDIDARQRAIYEQFNRVYNDVKGRR